MNGNCSGGPDSPPTKLTKTEFVLNTVSGAPLTLVHHEQHHEQPLRNPISSNNDANSDGSGNTPTRLITTNADSISTNVTVRAALLASPIPKPEPNLQCTVAQSQLEPSGNSLRAFLL